MNTLYRFFNNEGRLLYVGIAVDPGRRLKEHLREKAWWPQVVSITMEHLESRAAVRIAEIRAIQAEGPLYNVQMNPRRKPRGLVVYQLGSVEWAEHIAEIVDRKLRRAKPAERQRLADLREFHFSFADLVDEAS